jgi:O-methyltransferase involved in polyketide biosynthesis
MSRRTKEVREIVDFLEGAILEGQRVVLDHVREELRRRLREGEPTAMWQAAEIVLDRQEQAGVKALADVAAWLESVNSSSSSSSSSSQK